jgi:hypothetical protein
VADPTTAPSRPEEAYQAGLARESALAGEAANRVDRLTAARVAVFLGFLGSLALADPLQGSGEPLAMAASLLFLGVFVALVRRHRGLRREIRGHEVRARIHRIGLARLRRDWTALDELGLPFGPDEMPPPDHPYAADLHLFGHASLFRLVGPLTTAPGRSTLARWLTAPATPAEVARRQGAVRALKDQVELRHRLAALGVEGEAERSRDVEALLEWAVSPSWLQEERAVRLAATVLPPLTLGLFGAYLAAGLPPFWVLAFVLQIVALRRVHGRIAEEVDRAAAALGSVRRYAGQLEALGDLSREPCLDEIRDALTEVDGVSAHDALESLRRRLDFGESRRNMVYQALDLTLLLSVWVHRSLERWKERYGRDVGAWVRALGRAEALAALATLAYDHPGWGFPRVGGEEGGDRLGARDLGHPLLAPDARVANDVVIGPPGSFLLVTGSNMSGKSTLLRAVGANTVLAQAGAPVCAAELSMPPLSVWTSMMVGDSLEDGVSRFMAELLRLKAVVDAAREPDSGRPRVLYLLDEILQGTNTAERRVAARTALRHLLDAGAIGAVTTHDLTLHQAPDLERRARAHHFRETVERVDGRPRLHFDFRIRSGLATTTNALELLEAVGLGLDGVEMSIEGEEDAPPGPPGPESISGG